MPSKWEIVNGSKYAVDDHSSPRPSPEEYNPYEDPEFLRRMSILQADMRGSKKGGAIRDHWVQSRPPHLLRKQISLVRQNAVSGGEDFACGDDDAPTPDNNLYPRVPTTKKNNSRIPSGMRLRTRSGTDFRKLAELRRLSAIVIQKRVRRSRSWRRRGTRGL